MGTPATISSHACRCFLLVAVLAATSAFAPLVIPRSSRAYSSTTNLRQQQYHHAASSASPLQRSMATAATGESAVPSPPSMLFNAAAEDSTEPDYLSSMTETRSPTTTTALFAPEGIVDDATWLADSQQYTAAGPAPTSSWLSQPSLTQGRLIVIAAAALYGSNFATVKMLDEAMPMAASAALRFSLAAVIVTALVAKSERRLDDIVDRAGQGPAMWMGAEVGGWYCVGYLCQSIGLHTTDASKSAFFNALAVIVVPILDSLFKGKKIGGKGLGSIAMAIAGVGTLQLGPALMGSIGSHASHHVLQHVVAHQAHHAKLLESGDLFCLAQALFFGVGYWRLERATTAYPDQTGRITAGQLLAVAAGSIGYSVFGPDSLPSLSDLQGWLSDPFIVKSLIWTGLFSTALALYLETVALKVLSASELTILMTSVSLWGAAFAYFSMNEVMQPVGMLGGLMILSGCVLSSTADENSKSGAAEDELATVPYE